MIDCHSMQYTDTLNFSHSWPCGLKVHDMMPWAKIREVGDSPLFRFSDSLCIDSIQPRPEFFTYDVVPVKEVGNCWNHRRLMSLIYCLDESSPLCVVLYCFDGVVIAAQCTTTYGDLLCSPDYYFPASPISVANRRNRSTGTCESCWSSPKIWPKMRPRAIVRFSHWHSRCSTIPWYVRNECLCVSFSVVHLLSSCLRRKTSGQGMFSCCACDTVCGE